MTERLRYRERVGLRADIDDLGCLCWCRAEVLPVPRSLVRACRTLSCGARGCEEPT